MSFKATEQPTGGINIEPMETGTYPARLIGVSLVGLHAQSYQGEVKEPKNNIALTYEFLDEFLKDEEGNDLEDKPRFLTESMPFHNLSNNRAKSTERYNAIDPTIVADGDWSALLNTPLMVQVVQNAGKGKNAGRIFNNVSGVSTMRPKEAAKAGPLVNPQFLFDFYNATEEDWNKLPGAVKGIVRRALDFPGSEIEKWAEKDADRRDPDIKIEDADDKKDSADW
jgi:hypothetical protein